MYFKVFLFREAKSLLTDLCSRGNDALQSHFSNTTQDKTKVQQCNRLLDFTFLFPVAAS